ncbi:MAG: FAD binding domain-containing protein [Actinomycetota bacterium]|nr:FAD binding domain-containing protein [Acidimicrobiales bacterium]MDG2905356.1 FAD binding domain-containing protein [Acidimicrobiales bacterium]MEC8872572.1 FAD binding domain-containing protein [Actinomycetota bacterium]MEC8919743.1 FAD binding domain-containing protein [Actinomycetota bacterium]MED5438207.1 FAD binding domain-containing protein [Actinomycetota bacterium]
MTVTIARTLNAACAALAADPGALVLAGGTDLMVEVNRGGRTVGDVVVIDRVPELQGWDREGDVLRLGASLTYAEMADPALASLVPALAQAARTVGSPQIRAAGTIGGNLATASPAGDTLPVLAALDAEVEIRSHQGHRTVPLDEFVIGVKANDLAPGELIAAVRVPVLDGPQEFLKVGPRNAMVISVASLALVVDRVGRTVRVGLGSVAPVPLRAIEAEVMIAARLDWVGGRSPTIHDVERFAELVADATRPIDDHRGSADYRRHSVGVLARRALVRAFGEPTP